MVGFILHNTLSEHGSVARGICRADAKGNLESVVECTGIEETANGISCDTSGMKLSGNDPVSMNMWGFKPSVFDFLKDGFVEFLKLSAGDPKAEYYIPAVINTLMVEKKVAVTLLKTQSAWFGITNPKDKQAVVVKIRELIDGGVYPDDLTSLKK